LKQKSHPEPQRTIKGPKRKGIAAKQMPTINCGNNKAESGVPQGFDAVVCRGTLKKKIIKYMLAANNSRNSNCSF